MNYEIILYSIIYCGTYLYDILQKYSPCLLILKQQFIDLGRISLIFSLYYTFSDL